MLQEAIDLQNDAINKLINLTKVSLKDEITFKAPTGSGKTYMMAKFMNQFLQENTDFIFLVSSLSKGNLAEQNYKKFIEYINAEKFSNIKPYLITTNISKEENLYIPIDYNVYCLPIALDKKDGNLLKSGAFELFLLTETSLLNTNNPKSIILIKDECHIATNNLDKLKKYFNKTINFSATPKLEKGQVVDVEITEEEAERVKLIKRIENKQDEKLENAIQQLKDIKKIYVDKINVNPCLIIQISNKEKADEELQEIMAIVEKSDLKWMLIVNEKNKCMTNDKIKKLPVSKWKDFAKESLSTIDIIIFKLTISEGWDIPRACMIYQKRDVKSKILTKQVVGRVRRNPRLLDWETLDEDAKELALTAWVYGVVEEDNKKINRVEIINKNVNREIQIKTTKLKKLVNREKFNIANIIKMGKIKSDLMTIFELYKLYNEAPQNIKKECDKWTTDAFKWKSFLENIAEIKNNYNKYICNYDDSLEINKDENGKDIIVSFPENSYYYESENKTNISNCVWKKVDGSEDFYFDSEAEKEFVDKLKDLASENIVGSSQRIIKSINDNDSLRFLWGKNYLSNSEIKYEYYLDGSHFSYPDLIMKDGFDNIHIFEIKSINKSSKILIDDNKYNEKVNELKRCFKTTSKLTKDIFYLPIKKQNEWTILRYKNGNEEIFTWDEFRERLRKNN